MKFHPFLGVGYSYFNDRTQFRNREPIVIEEDGFNANLGLTYDIGRNWFLSADYSAFRRDIGEIRINQNIDFIEIGIGIRF